MNPDLNRLQPYPFERIRRLLEGLVPPDDLAPVSLSIGEPQRPSPAFVLDVLSEALPSLSRYPTTRGTEELRTAIADWLRRRYSLNIGDALAERHTLPVNGTREALFAIAQCLVDRTQPASTVLIPNPFYQIYEGAALMAGARPQFYAIGADAADDDLDAIDNAACANAQMIYVCNPGNPTGSVLSEAAWHRLIERAQQHDFVIISDECYSEIYRQSAVPPCGLLQAATSLGITDFSRCLAFHSLSKRSNLPGLRSGFVAGDAELIERFTTYRTYHGCSMPLPAQHASIAAWGDEDHVVQNRLAYDSHFEAMVPLLEPVLPLSIPDAGFYLWPSLPISDETFTRRMFAEQHLRVVPGSYLARTVAGNNPGEQRVRLALVASREDCTAAAERIVSVLSH